MVRRVFCLLFVVVSTAFAACRGEPTSPAASRMLLRDEEAPECVDTVYEDSTTDNSRAAGGPPSQSSSNNACGVVVIYY